MGLQAISGNNAGVGAVDWYAACENKVFQRIVTLLRLTTSSIHSSGGISNNP